MHTKTKIRADPCSSVVIRDKKCRKAPSPGSRQPQRRCSSWCGCAMVRRRLSQIPLLLRVAHDARSTGLPQTKNRVAYWHTIRGMSQGAVANLLGVQRQTISNWERDITLPTSRRVDALYCERPIPSGGVLTRLRPGFFMTSHLSRQPILSLGEYSSSERILLFTQERV
ncbi:MAG: hypothetical protein JWN15_3242 [Firmicutes bacterium]|nr:hypothetical protein [Bacillota bacterium]